MHITIMRGVFDPIDPDDRIEADWNTVAELLTAYNDADALYSSMTRKPRDVKEAVPMFNLWQFRDLEDGAEQGRRSVYKDGVKTGDYETIPGTIRRCANNAIALHGIVLDYDGKASLRDAIDEMRRETRECVIYTTYSHGVEGKGERFRVVMPFSRPMPVAEFESKLDDLKNRYPDADNASWSMSQAIYLHSAAIPELAFATRLPGAMIDPDDFKASEPKPEPKPEPQIVPKTFARDWDADTGNAYRDALLKALSTCSGVRRGASRGNAGMLGLATLVRHAGGDYADFDQLCDATLAYDSCARSDQSVRRDAWSASRDCKATARFRDAWIAEHGGSPFRDHFRVSKTVTRMSRLDEICAKYGTRTKRLV